VNWRRRPLLAAALALGAAVMAPIASFAGQAAAPAPVASAIGADNAALIIIDIQNFYFEGGRVPLVGSVEASLKARQVLDAFRKAGRPVIHVRHMPKQDPGSTDPQYAIHPNVAPLPGEAVVVKHYANAFRETDLTARLKTLGVKTLVICGMQTQMCVEAAVRHAADLGYEVVLVEDACATRDLTFGGTNIPARQVHAAVLAAMNGTYAKIVAADTIK
jgi:nicotinamidase-related amidase